MSSSVTGRESGEVMMVEVDCGSVLTVAESMTLEASQLIDAGATVELGGPEELASLPEQGAFFPVTVLSFDDARTPAVHELEAFGPVTSVLGYSGDIADAVEIAALGGDFPACRAVLDRAAYLQLERPSIADPVKRWLARVSPGLLRLKRVTTRSGSGRISPMS